MFDRLSQWWHAPEPSPPLSPTAMVRHGSRGLVKLLPLYGLVVVWQYTLTGRPGVVLALGGGVALLLAVSAGVLGALERKYRAAVAFGLTIAVLGQLGPFVTELGGLPEYVATASLVLVVVCALGAILGYAEVRRLQTTAVER